MQNIKDILTENAGVTPTVKLKEYTRSDSDTVSLRYGKIGDVISLYHYLYDNATVYLESKHQKFVDFFSRLAS